MIAKVIPKSIMGQDISVSEVKEVEEEFIEIEAEAGSNGINISEEVVATIASIAASEVNGVASMNGGFVGGLSEMLGKKTKGVKVQVGEKDTVIDNTERIFQKRLKNCSFNTNSFVLFQFIIFII